MLETNYLALLKQKKYEQVQNVQKAAYLSKLKGVKNNDRFSVPNFGTALSVFTQSLGSSKIDNVFTNPVNARFTSNEMSALENGKGPQAPDGPLDSKGSITG